MVRFLYASLGRAMLDGHPALPPDVVLVDIICITL